MGRRATGSIDKVRDGHRVRVTIGGRRTTVGVYPTRTSAEAARVAILDELDRRGEVDASEAVGPWVLSWLDARERSRAVRDVASERGRFRSSIESDPIARVALRRLTRGDVLAWVDRMRGKGLAPQSVRNTIAVLRGALASAVDSEVIRVNHAAGIRLPRSARTEDPWTWLRPAEVAALLSAVALGHERHIVSFAVATGLRAGELCALRDEDVTETHMVVRYGGPPAAPTKSGRIRRVPLFPAARRALEAWREGREAWAAEGRGARNPHGLVFPGRRGAFRDPNHVIRWATWKLALEEAGLERRVRWHDLRHTCASSLVSGLWGRKWDLKEVCEVLGHSDVKVTERYAHLSSEAIAEAAAATSGHAAIGLESASPVSAEALNLADLQGAPDKDRTCDLRFRKPEYHAIVSTAYGGRGRFLADCRHLLEEAAAGRPVTDLVYRMRADIATAFGETLAGLSGEHATARAIALAEAYLFAFGHEANDLEPRRRSK